MIDEKKFSKGYVFYLVVEDQKTLYVIKEQLGVYPQVCQAEDALRRIETGWTPIILTREQHASAILMGLDGEKICESIHDPENTTWDELWMLGEESLEAFKISLTEAIEKKEKKKE